MKEEMTIEGIIAWMKESGFDFDPDPITVKDKTQPIIIYKAARAMSNPSCGDLIATFTHDESYREILDDDWVVLKLVSSLGNMEDNRIAIQGWRDTR